MIVKGLTVGLLQENCYVLGCESTKRGVIIDPGDSARAILQVVRREGLTIEKIINTHAHFDHVMAVDDIRAATERHLPPAPRRPVRAARTCPNASSLWLGSSVEPIDDPDEFLEAGQIIEFGDESLEVRFTPGHAPGHVVFVDHKNEQLFGGDTLFQGSIGRFDLPGADGPTLLRSIREQLLTLPDDYIVYPGHGEATTIGEERLHNPFVGLQATAAQR